MWKNKPLAALLLAVLVGACGALTVAADSELISQDQIKADTVNYVTAEVEYGDIVRTQSCGAAEFDPIRKRVIYTGKTGVFVKFVADRSGNIKAGDIIAEISVNVDEVAIAEKELKLQRIREELQSGTTSRSEEIAELTKARESAADDYSYRKQTVKIQIRQAELEKFIYEKNSEIAGLEEELQEMYADREPFYVRSPIDGKLSNSVYFHQGDVMKNGDEVCTVIDDSVKMVKCPETEFYYGKEATVASSKNKGDNVLRGKVVISSSVIPDSTGSFSIISPENADTYTGGWNFMTASTNILEMKNVLLIPNQAKDTDMTNDYATVLGADGVLHKRKIKLFLNSQKSTWVLNGLKEGDVVIAD